MSKPILIIKFPQANSETQRSEMKGAGELISKQLTDYHVLCLMDNRRDEVEFQCLNSPHTETDFKELKEELMKSIKM